jgi:hypothetical protein
MILVLSPMTGNISLGVRLQGIQGEEEVKRMMKD